MEANSIFNTVQPLITLWNANHQKHCHFALVEDDGLVTISPVDADFRTIPGALLSDIVLLANVYGWSFGIHTTQNGEPYILL